MKLPKKIREILASIKDYFESEKEIIRLKLIQKGSSGIATLFSLVFILVLFHVTAAMIGLWLGFWLSEVFESFSMGFGITVAFYILWLLVCVIFRKSILVKPFYNFLISALTQNEEIPDKKTHES